MRAGCQANSRAGGQRGGAEAAPAAWSPAAAEPNRGHYFHPMRRLTTFVRILRDERRALGWRALVRKRGWRLVVMVVAYYLVRDVLLYIVLPLGVAAGVRR